MHRMAPATTSSPDGVRPGPSPTIRPIATSISRRSPSQIPSTSVRTDETACIAASLLKDLLVRLPYAKSSAHGRSGASPASGMRSRNRRTSVRRRSETSHGEAIVLITGGTHAVDLDMSNRNELPRSRPPFSHNSAMPTLTPRAARSQGVGNRTFNMIGPSSRVWLATHSKPPDESLT